ncbi:response regulator [Flavobacterium jejuense]|uniref:Response regulator n=1 Tax=Flavobacterium jejuense TaxID=1544455 RepID=A0ABX0IU23_9FLAO|nr:response regulator [Flavobacterium jejuense]NHN26329.1 response regulator [Flavobacterium jejuense]
MKKLKRIMLVDDDPFTNKYNEIVLNQMNASENIVIFQNAKEALQYLDEMKEEVNLILLDINMPIMNGWQFIEHYESLEKEKQTAIVVVMLTSSMNSDDKKRALDFKSIKKFINKPMTAGLVKEILALFE